MANSNEEGLLELGATLANGKYKIERYLASGGFGKTYLALDTAFDEKVAIKELYIKGVCGRKEDGNEVGISLSENRTFFAQQQEKFRKEARRLRRLQNEHIVRVHDLFDENGTSYYVMDYVEGESLSANLKRRSTGFSEAEVLSVLTQVLDALETVHNEGIWHLDLKPANIMMDRQGNVSLIDFGASKQLRNKDGESMSTSANLAYTQGYAPVEQMEQNMDKFGPWTDIYALGATLYHLLTKNTLPLPSDVEEDPDTALPMPANISKLMKELILWMMKPNRTKRPQNVQAIREYMAKKSGGKVAPVKVKPAEADAPATRSFVVPEKKDETLLVRGKEKGNKSMMWIGLVAVAAIAIGVLVAVLAKSGGDTPDPDETAVAADSDSVSWVDDGVVEAVEAPPAFGTANIADGAVYEGELDPSGLPHGHGTITMSNGDRFEGEMNHGAYVSGRYEWKDGDIFVGTFTPDGAPLEGEWQ